MNLLNKFIKRIIKENVSNNETWFHGTNYDFNEFDLSYFGKTDNGWWGIGIYFHSDENTAKVYGNTIIKAKLNYKSPLILPVNYSGEFLYDTLVKLGMELPKEYQNFSSMKIIRQIGKETFTDFIKNYFDVMIVNYAQGSKEAVVFNKNIIVIKEKYKNN
jgi:hypothetical protein